MRSREDIENRILSLVDKYRHLFVRVVLFGSYARNQQGKESDIDLFIESDIPTNKLITSTAYNRFHDELYEEFDYTVPFDLLVFGGNRDRKKVKSSPLYKQVQNDGVILYEQRAETV